MAIDRGIGEISESELQDLITNCVSEGRTIEYKEQLTVSSEGDKKEFLADVSSFSNSSGGDIVFGVSESGGLPSCLIGLTVSDKDAELLRIDQIIRNGIQPRIVGIQYQWVDLVNSKRILVIRIPRSWNSPHMVTYKGHDKFYARSSAGKHPLDVHELRGAFLESASLSEQIKWFRRDRISAIIAGETSLPVESTAKLVVHVISLESFGTPFFVDLKEIVAMNPAPIAAAGWNIRYNFDGVISYSQTQGTCSTYIQYYRNAVIEAVDCRTLKPEPTVTSGGGSTIPSSILEERLVKCISTQLDIMKKSGVHTPIYVFVTLVGVKDYRMASRNSARPPSIAGEDIAVDRDILMLPEVVVHDYGAGILEMLRPILDTLWNACGFEKSTV